MLERLLKRPAGTLAAAALLALCACRTSEPDRPSVGTNSNWLRACASAGECGDLPACSCGACTAPCADDAECSRIGDARCALGADDPAAWAECESREPALSAGICLPRCDPGSCADGQACVSGACVLAPLPDVSFCTAVAQWDAGLRAREEELLELVQQLRTSGDRPCSAGSAPPGPAPALRLDSRLTCAARVWAADLDAAAAAGLTDSQGRTTEQRLAAAGYDARLWGDSFALEVTSTAAALELMLADEDTCARLEDAAYTEIGVGYAGSTFAMTIGAQ